MNTLTRPRLEQILLAQASVPVEADDPSDLTAISNAAPLRCESRDRCPQEAEYLIFLASGCVHKAVACAHHKAAFDTHPRRWDTWRCSTCGVSAVPRSVAI